MRCGSLLGNIRGELPVKGFGTAHRRSAYRPGACRGSLSYCTGACAAVCCEFGSPRMRPPSESLVSRPGKPGSFSDEDFLQDPMNVDSEAESAIVLDPGRRRLLGFRRTCRLPGRRAPRRGCDRQHHARSAGRARGSDAYPGRPRRREPGDGDGPGPGIQGRRQGPRPGDPGLVRPGGDRRRGPRPRPPAGEGTAPGLRCPEAGAERHAHAHGARHEGRGVRDPQGRRHAAGGVRGVPLRPGRRGGGEGLGVAQAGSRRLGVGARRGGPEPALGLCRRPGPDVRPHGPAGLPRHRGAGGPGRRGAVLLGPRGEDCSPRRSTSPAPRRRSKGARP